MALNEQATTWAWVSNVGIGLGLAGIGVGTYLVLSGSPHAREKGAQALQLRAVGAVLPGGGRLGVAASF